MMEFDPSRDLEQHHADCRGWALTCCAGNRIDAEEVLQNSYLKVLEGRAVYRGHSSVRTWLFGVIRLTSIEHRRRQAVRRFFTGTPLGMTDTIDPAGGAELRLEQSESTRILNRALAQLADRQREVLHLVFYQELTIEEAAGVLQVSVGTARTHYERGKERLRQLLASERVQ
jgi:RNA polymerase sigma factor (sigma-70 family)